MDETSGLLTIGRFSALTRLSVRMLRHYDAHGVLVPAHVDPDTGYRLYAPEQVADADAVRGLRDVGVGVSSIPALLAARGTPRWRQTLGLQREALREELAAAQGRLTLIDRMISEGDRPMTPHDNLTTNPAITIARQRVEAMTAVILRGTVPTYSDEGLLWARATPLLGAAGIRPAGACGVIELVHAYVERDVDLAVLVPVAPGTTAPAPLEVVHLPARDCIVARVTGTYDLLTEANRELGRRVAAEALRLAPEAGDGLADKGFNLYDVDPHEPGAPAEVVPVTRVCWPLSVGAA